MKFRAAALLPLGLAAVPVRGAAQARAGAFPPVTIAGTEVRQMHSSQTGRDYDIYVYLPASATA